MKEELQKLIEQYGADAVVRAAAEAANQHVPTINTPVVTDEQLLNTISQLDAAVTDILEAGRKNEETYQNKAALVRHGISFSHNVIGAIAAEALRQAGLAHKNRQVDFEKRFLQGEATITGTPGGYFSTTYPFVLVPIPAGTEHIQTNTPHYDVTLCVTAADDIGKVTPLKSVPC